MIEPLYVLLVAPPRADTPPAAEAALRRAGFDPRSFSVATPQGLGAALTRRPWDAAVIEAVAGLDPLDALAWIRRKQPGVPVFVVDPRPEDTVALVEGGATDLIASTQLSRLGLALAKVRRPRSTRSADLDQAFHALAAHMPIGLYRSTDDGRILYANAALARILGCDSVEDLLGLDIRSDLAYPRTAFEERIRTTGEVVALEVSWQHAGGRTVHTREHTRAVRDAAGELLYYEGTMEDVTEEREALLRERRRAAQLEDIVRFCASLDVAANLEELHRLTVEAATAVLEVPGVILLRVGADGFSVAAANEGVPAEALHACAQHFAAQLSQAKLEGLEPGSRIPPVACPHLAETGFPLVEPFPLLHRGRAVGALLVLNSDAQGLQEGYVRIAEALSWHAASALARWDAEGAVRASEATLRSIASATGHVLYRRRFGAVSYDYISDSAEKLTGYTPVEVNARGGLLPLILETQVISGAGLPEGSPAVTGEPYLALHRLRTREGELLWVEDRAYPWMEEDGAAIGVVGVLEDVTERQRRQSAEQEHAHRLLEQQRALLDLSALDLDPQGFAIAVTEAAAAVTGTARASIWLLDESGLGAELERLLVCRDLYRLDEERHEAIAPMTLTDLGHGQLALREHRVYANDNLSEHDLGSAFLDAYYAEHDIQAVLVATVRRHGEVMGFVALEHVGATRDWTPDEREFMRALADLVALAEERAQRLRAETALRASERRYRAVSEMASDYAFAVRYDEDGIGHLEWFTRAFERITGYSADAFRSPEDLILRIVHPEDVPLIRDADEQLARGEAADLTFRVVTREGLIRWVHHRARPVLDDDGRLRYLYATGQDISERIHFEVELEEARDRAEAARAEAEVAQAEAEAMARQKGDLLANMSHEIRTPLTGIIGFAEVLSEEVGPDHREFAELIATSGRRLLETLNSVLDLAKLESGRLSCEPIPLDAAREVEQVAGLLVPMADAKGIALRVEADGPLPAELDRGCLSRIVTNLVGNAIKFTDEGHVTVSLQPEGEHLCLSVSDTGAGMDAAFLPHLFEEFCQEPGGGGDRGQEGSGLGLAITRRLVELMHGAIGVESEKGVGTTFTVTLPRHGSAPSVQEPPFAEPEEAEPVEMGFAALFDSDEEEGGGTGGATDDPPSYTVRPFLSDPQAGEDDWVNLSWGKLSEGDGDGVLSLDILPPVSEPPRAPSLPVDPPVDVAVSDLRPRVLVVEDNDETRQLLERVLHTHYCVEAVRDARMALERMSRQAYDVLVLDIHLGGKQTGADVLRIARTLPGYETATAVAITAYALPGDREQFLRAGFDAYVSKPFAVSELLDALREAGVALKE